MLITINRFVEDQKGKKIKKKQKIATSRFI